MIRGRLIYAGDTCIIPKRRKPDYEILLINPHNVCSLFSTIKAARTEGYIGVILFGYKNWISYAEDTTFLDLIENSKMKMYIGVANKFDTVRFQQYFSYPHDAKYQGMINDIGIYKEYSFRETYPVLWSWLCFILVLIIPFSIIILYKVCYKLYTSRLQCVVCLEILGDKIIERLPCEHVFHQTCIRRWFLENHNCPICRNTVSNKDEGFEYLPDFVFNDYATVEDILLFLHSLRQQHLQQAPAEEDVAEDNEDRQLN